MNRSLLLYSHSTTIFLRFIASSTRRYGLITNCREGPSLIPTGYNQHRRPHSRGMHHAIRVRLKTLIQLPFTHLLSPTLPPIMCEYTLW